jgi:hypothetical protein
MPRRGKGQPEGSAVTGKTGKLWVAEMGLVSNDATGQNNSNLTSLTALVVNGEWELILAISSHYCFTPTKRPNELFILVFNPPQPPIWGAFNI